MQMYAVADIATKEIYALYADVTEAWIVCDDFADGSKWVYETEVTHGKLVDEANAYNARLAAKRGP